MIYHQQSQDTAPLKQEQFINSEFWRQLWDGELGDDDINECDLWLGKREERLMLALRAKLPPSPLFQGEIYFLSVLKISFHKLYLDKEPTILGDY